MHRRLDLSRGLKRVVCSMVHSGRWKMGDGLVGGTRGLLPSTTRCAAQSPVHTSSGELSGSQGAPAALLAEAAPSGPSGAQARVAAVAFRSQWPKERLLGRSHGFIP